MNLKVYIHDPKVAAKLDRNTTDGPLHLRILAKDPEGKLNGDAEIVIFKADAELFLISLEEAISEFRAESTQDDR